jgi:hypothetical protein
MFLSLLLLPATSVFASTDTHKGSFSVAEPVQVAGQQLAAGNYMLKWNGTGPATEVNIIHNGKVVATVPAQVETLGHKANHDAVDMTTDHGINTITGIQFEGKAYALEIG